MDDGRLGDALQSGRVLNWIFFALVTGAIVAAAHLGHMQEVSQASANSAKTAVDIAIGLIGQMALWLGFMRILEEAGLLRSIARTLKPIMTRLFPDVPADHPAMAAMILNFAANMAGLTNAATPFGLRAMQELDKLNDRKGVASNAMCLFLAINTSGLAVLPLGAIAVRASLGATNLSGIVLPSILSTNAAMIVAIITAKLLQRTRFFRAGPAPALSAGGASAQADVAQPVKGLEQAEKLAEIERPRVTPIRLSVMLAIGLLLVWGFARNFEGMKIELSALGVTKELLEHWFLPLLMLAIVLYGFGRQVKVYEALVQGAKEGFNIAVMIIPFMVAILVAIGMFRASGAMDAITQAIAPFTSALGFPAEALPMALIKPLSGSGSLAVMTETMKTYGPDSFVGFLVCVINGSFETTFYVLAVYFGSVGVRATRHTVLACLASDLTGLVAATVFSKIFY
jgi:spore maturation protein SpmA